MSGLSPGCVPKRTSADHSELWVHAQICPTGKSLLIFRNRVKPLLQKYFASLPTQISSLIRTVPARQEGRCARHQRGAGCGGRGGVRQATASRTNDAEAYGQVVSF